MSRGPWKAETHARRNGGTGHGPLSNAQRTPSDHVEPWKDTRAEAKAKAKADIDALRTSILWKVASQNRKDAQARHAPRYIGALPASNTITPERVHVHRTQCYPSGGNPRQSARHRR